jgi:hypothetical protein
MKIPAVLTVIAMQGIFAAGLAMGDDVSPTTVPSDKMAAATTRPDIQSLRDREMDCQTALDRARADCLRRLVKDDDYKAAVADLALSQSVLDQAGDAEGRANAASGRMAAKKHLDDLKTAALASDVGVAKAAAALKEASDSYQTAMMQEAASATMSHVNSDVRATESDGVDAAVQEMLERGEKERLVTLKSLLDDIRQLDDHLGRIPEDSDHALQRDGISQQIISDRHLIARGERLKGHYLPQLKQEIGSTGMIAGTLQVFQIIDGNDVIISAGEDLLFWVKGLDTSKLVDGQAVEMHRALRVSGTKRYDTAGGSSKTVFLLEPFGPIYP